VLQLGQLLAQAPRFEGVLLLVGVNDLTAWLGQPDAGGTQAAHEVATAGPERLARAFDVVPRALASGPFWRRTALFDLVRSTRSRTLGQPEAQDAAGSVYVTWRAHRGSARRWRTELPDSGAAQANFRANLEAIEGLCARHGVGLVLITQPALWCADLAPELEARLWMGGVGDFQRSSGCEYYTSGALAQGLALYNQELSAFGHERGLPVLDLAAALASDPRYFYDDVHFNEEGARAVADFLAPRLADLYPR
jgi:hypothetical protein